MGDDGGGMMSRQELGGLFPTGSGTVDGPDFSKCGRAGMGDER